MSQPLLLDPIVSVAPALTGVGNGTTSIDRLTHFTINQVYTLTCIAKTPDTLFAVTGSLDGPVGIAVVGTQFYDEDLKVFFTIQQGSTPFEIGDVFTFTVQQGTDLNQDNIDDYDELPQKNFGVGVKGSSSGDNNLRYNTALRKAYRYVGNLYFEAAVAGNSAVTIEYLNPVPAVQATLDKQDLTFDAPGGVFGNGYSVEYVDYTPQSKSSVTIQNLSFTSDAFGLATNGISIEYTAGGIAGAEVVSVLGQAISVQIDSGVSTAAQIKTAIDAFPAAAALVDISFFGLSSNPQTVQGPTFLTGGLDNYGNAGSEVVLVAGQAITVVLQNGVSTATQVKTALEANVPFQGTGITVTINGLGSNPQVAPDAQEFLAGGANGYGYAGSEVAEVLGSAIRIYLENNKSTATQVKAAFDALPAATALASATIVGLASTPQNAPIGPLSLANGKDKEFAFNHEEITDSGSFVEGNAGIKAKDANLSGRLTVNGYSRFKDAVTLEDQNAYNDSGAAVVNAQKVINNLIQNGKITLGTANNEAKLSWSYPTLTFNDDIVLRFNDTGFVNTIESSTSPVTIADGESFYAIVDRNSNASIQTFVAALVPVRDDCFRIATRIGDNLRLWDNSLIRHNKSARIGEGLEGGAGGVYKVTFFDPISTVKPTGVSATFDNVAATNNDLVVFTNLAIPADNNKVFIITGVGTSIVYTAVDAFETGQSPANGDLIIVKKGDGFKNQIAEFDGTSFKVNPYTRYFNGADYWELSSLQTADILNNTTAEVFSLTYSGSENLIVDFSILRGTTNEVGTIHMVTDGTTVSKSIVGSAIGVSGVDFNAYISGADLILDYVADNSGAGGVIKYTVKRWSNSAGGPAGLPSYSTGGGGSTPAAGSAGDVQFNSGGVLGASSSFNFNSATNVLNINGLEIGGLSSAIVLNDNQIAPAVITSYAAASYPFVIIEFSVSRDGVYDVGRMFVSNNGSTDIGFSVDSVPTQLAGTGVAFSAVFNGSNIEIQYTSTSSGFNGSFKYSFRRWV